MIIKIDSSECSNDEWDLIELQGVVIPLEEPLTGKVLGRLKYIDNGKASIQVGNMLVEGKVQKLSKPFTLLEKIDSSDEKDHSLGIEGVSYIVVGSVTRTMIFTTSRHCPPNPDD